MAHPDLSRGFAQNPLRPRIEAAIESLMALLDVIDGDPDLEDSDEDDQCDDEGAIEVDDDRENEASLCGISAQAPHGLYRAGAMHYDLETEEGW